MTDRKKELPDLHKQQKEEQNQKQNMEMLPQ